MKDKKDHLLPYNLIFYAIISPSKPIFVAPGH